MSERWKTGVAILTLNAIKDLPRLLPLIEAERPDRIVVFDSASADGTAQWVQQQTGVELCAVNRSDFNHGATREFARRYLGTEIVVLMTQDVLPKPGWLATLTAPIRQEEAVVAYARQLPHVGADVFEAFPRDFNYPPKSQRRTLSDVGSYGVYTFFCSDSCSAYLNTALDRIGGFEPVLTNEDYFAVARILQDGGAIAYVADAEVHHSHRYALRAEFERYFDTGYVRAEHSWVTHLVGQAERRGTAMALRLFKLLLAEKPWLIPYAVMQMAAKWAGYRLGYWSYGRSRTWCRKFSSQKYYWLSKHYRHPRR